MKKVKTATFRGTTYRVDTDEIEGVCVVAHEPLTIYIVGGLSNNQRTLDVMIHEALHACFPYMKEDRVTQAGTDIARFLWRSGWRLNKRARE